MDLEQVKQNMKVVVRGAYDLQKLRMQMGNRLVGNYKARLGQAPSTSEDELDAEGKKILKKLRVEHSLISKAIADRARAGKLPETYKGMELIDGLTDFQLVESFVELERVEKQQFKRLESYLDRFPVYNEFLKGVKGCGPVMSGVIICELDIRKAKYASSIWKFCGLDVASDGRGRSRRTEHLEDKQYVNKDGEQATRKGITFSPFIKTKLLGVLGSSFLRAGENKYSQIYYDYKHRLEHRPDWAERSKGHRHAAANRYMIKLFLVDLYSAWRALEGLEVHAPYHEEKLGLKHAA